MMYWAWIVDRMVHAGDSGDDGWNEETWDLYMTYVERKICNQVAVRRFFCISGDFL